MSSQSRSGPAEKIKILVIPGMDPVGDWIADVARSQPDMALAGTVRDLPSALESVEKLAPHVVLADIGSGVLQQAGLLSRLAGGKPGAAVIVVAMMGEVDMVRQAMLYGAQGFLLKPFSEAELLSSIRQAYELVARRRAQLAEIPHLPDATVVEPSARAEIVAVFSPKGGVGCTTIAVNLAVALKDATGKSSILVDADLRFGDVDTALNITPATSIATLLPDLDEMDNELLDRSLVSHSSGIRVVVAPPHLDMADVIRPEQVRKLLIRLSELGEGYVVVDSWSSLDDVTLSIMDLCQHLVVVTTPQVTALRDVHRLLEALGLLDYEREKTVLVLNNCYHRSDINLSDVERALGYPIAQVIEYAPSQVTASVNRGVPLMVEFRDSPPAQSITRLARLLAERGSGQGSQPVESEPGQGKPEKPKKRGLFQNRPGTATKVRP